MDKNDVMMDFGYFKTKVPSDFHFIENISNIEIENCRVHQFECVTRGGCEEITHEGEQVYSSPAYYEEKKTLIYGSVKIEIIYFEFFTQEDHFSNENKIKDTSSNSAKHYCNNNIHIVIDWHYFPPKNTISKSYGRRVVSSPIDEMRDFQKTALENIELIDEKILSDKDEKTLAYLAKNDNCNWVRRDAADMINDNSVLTDIAFNDENPDVRRVAIGKISDELTLIKLFEKEKDPKIRLEIVKGITDENYLRDIAENDTDNSISRVAVEMISDESILKDIVKNTQKPLIRWCAFENPNLKDENFLKDVAKNEKDSFRSIASKKISNRSLSNILWKIRYVVF